jgi:hypothetical protein
MNAMDRVTNAPRLREALLELYDHKQYVERRRAGERFTLNADGTVSGLVMPRHGRRAYLDAIARQLDVDEENFESYREALADGASTAEDARLIRELIWPLVREWRRMILAGG